METFGSFTQNAQVDCEKFKTEVDLFIEFLAWVQVDISFLLKATLNLIKTPHTYFTP